MNHSHVIRRREKTWTEAPNAVRTRPHSTSDFGSDYDAMTSSMSNLQSVPLEEYVSRSPQRRYGSVGSAASYSHRIAPPPLRRDLGRSAMMTMNYPTNGGGGGGGGGDLSGEKQDMLQWINSALIRGSQEPVTNVEAAMADGITLARLARVLVGEEPPCQILHPSMLSIQRRENLKVCLAWLREKGVQLPNIHVEDLANGSAKSGLALCKALRTYDMSRHEGMGSKANLDKDDVAILGWLGSVVEEDITSYQALSDGHILCKLFRRMAPRCLDEDLSSKGSQERLDCALVAAETNLSISRGLLDTKKLAQSKEDSYKLFSYLQRCQITYKQLRRQEFMRLEKERSTANRIPPPSPVPPPEVGGRVPFGLVDQRALATAKAGPMASPEPNYRGRSGSPGRSAEQRPNRAQQTQRNQVSGSEGREQSPPYTTVRTPIPTNPSGGSLSSENSSWPLGEPKTYPPPYEPPPPAPPSTSGGEQHPHHSSLPSTSLLPKGPSMRPKGSNGLGTSAQHSPLLAQHRAGGEIGVTNGERQGREEKDTNEACTKQYFTADKSEVGSREEPVSNTGSNGYTHPPPSHPPPPLPKASDHPLPSEGHLAQRQALRNGETDSGTGPTPLSVLSQHLQSSSSPHHVQSHFLSRLELMEHELAEVRERLDTERVQFLQKLQEIAVEEEKKRKELEKEFKKLAEVARQLSKHYDTCFVNLARQIAHVQDRMGMESEDTIGALVGDTCQEEGKTLDTKKLIQEISSLKEQMQSIITGPAGSAPSEPGSKDPEEEQRTSSGSSPPSSLPITPEPMSAPDITLQAAEGMQKKLFVRKGKKVEKKKEKPKTGVNISPSPSSSSLVELAHSAKITHANHKKLSKFFGEDLPKVENLQTFLAGLGFPELLPKFSKEQVTLNELQLMTEQHLIELGIPMGPRLAILSEIQSLESVSVED